MATLFHHLIGQVNVDTQLLAPGDIRGAIKSISITNAYVGDTGTISLFLEEEGASSFQTFYIIKDVNLPGGSTLLLDDPGMLSYDKSAYGLYARTGGLDSDVYSVLINV